MSPDRIEEVYGQLLAAARAGSRCPMRDQLPADSTYALQALARSGRIFVEVFVHNFRRVTILDGEFRGACTASPPNYGGRAPQPYLTVGLETRRNGRVIRSGPAPAVTLPFNNGQRVGAKR